MLFRLRLMLAALLAFVAAPALAWNPLGHKTVAEIAWQQLDEPMRAHVVETLRRNPRFDIDFVKLMPADVLQADKTVQDHWVFQQAATWPDIIRKTEYDRPWWHFVDFPIFPDGRMPIAMNLSAKYPSRIPETDYNCMQAFKHCLATLKGKDGPEAKALAYCWLMHLAGDIHQPMHSCALFCDAFPDGDRGGNLIYLNNRDNLHARWDNLLGKDFQMSDVARTVVELSDRSRYSKEWETAGQEMDVRKWVDESFVIAKSFVYSDVILKAVKETKPGTKMEPIELPVPYMQEAGDIARRRVVMAGVRLGEALKDVQHDQP